MIGMGAARSNGQQRESPLWLRGGSTPYCSTQTPKAWGNSHTERSVYVERGASVDDETVSAVPRSVDLVRLGPRCWRSLDGSRSDSTARRGSLLAVVSARLAQMPETAQEKVSCLRASEERSDSTSGRTYVGTVGWAPQLCRRRSGVAKTGSLRPNSGGYGGSARSVRTLQPGQSVPAQHAFYDTFVSQRSADSPRQTAHGGAASRRPEPVPQSE